MNFLIVSIIAFFSQLTMMQPDSLEEQEVPLLTIGIIADVQYADADPSGTRYYRSSLARLKEAYAAFLKENVDMVINLGDLIDHDFGSYKPVMELIDSSGLRTIHITGNHDYAVDRNKIEKIPPLVNNRYGYSSSGGEDITIVFLNGNEISTYASSDSTVIYNNQVFLDSMKTAGAINAMDWNGGTGSQQMAFFEKVLRNAAKRGEKVIVACHFPVYPENVHNLLNYKEVLYLIRKYDNVIAWLSGHNHAGNYCMQGKTHFVTFKGMVENRSENSFAIADIYDDHIRIRGFGREESRILRY